MKSFFHTALAAILFTLSLGALPAGATILGDVLTISTTDNGATPQNVPNVLVGPGIEATFISSNSSGSFLETRVDLFDGGFLLEAQNLLSLSFLGAGIDIQITGLDWVDDPLNGILTNVQLINVSGTSANLGDISNLLFSDSPGLDSGSISLELFNDFRPSETVSYEFSITAEHGSTNPIPEPSTMILLGTGLAGIIAWRRKQVA